MIDGVKIVCNLEADRWLRNGNLTFHSTVNESTGEVLDKNRYAVTKGLRFELVRSTVSDKVHTFCKGSLAKHYNNGLHNGFDYDFNHFTETLQTLQSQYHINPENATLQNFEFGVNIISPIPIKTLLQGIKAIRGNSFAMLKINGVNVGYQMPKQQYTLKIYDKGLQIGNAETNLLRIEIAVNKMAYVSGLNIKTLADLQSLTVWHELANILLTFWCDTIFIPKKVMYKLMANHDQKKFLRYMDNTYWHDLTKEQRYKNQKRLNRLLSLYSADATKEIISNLIAEKAQRLATVKGHDLTNFSNTKTLHFEKAEKSRFNRLDKGLKSDQNNPVLTNQLQSKKDVQKVCLAKPIKRQKCQTCKNNIKHKKKGAKFCSTKCKSKALSNLRKQKRCENKSRETKALTKLLKIVQRETLWLMVTYSAGAKNTFSDYMHQSEINAPPNWIRQIKQVEIKSQSIVLTSYRAKELIKEITNINYTKN